MQSRVPGNRCTSDPPEAAESQLPFRSAGGRLGRGLPVLTHRQEPAAEKCW